MSQILEIAGKSLKEIANMPLYAMTKFMREHHDRRWSVPADKATFYKVKVELCLEVEMDVEATSDEMAKEQARREAERAIRNEFCDADTDFIGSKIIQHRIY